MSLSARIAVRPSRRLEVLAGCVAVGGVVVATVSAACRWPYVAWPLAAIAVVAAIAAIAVVRVGTRTTSGWVLSVSDRAEIAVSSEPASSDGAGWLLDDSTTMWPGFAVIGLTRGDGARPGRSMRLAVFDAELSPIDRRALHRFLLWSLRGGLGRGAPTHIRAPR